MANETQARTDLDRKSVRLLVSLGYSAEQIAQRLCLALGTVKRYRA